jgi:hypothetical protein
MIDNEWRCGATQIHRKKIVFCYPRRVRVPVRVNGQRQCIDGHFIARSPLITAREWRHLLTAESSGQQHDAVEFVESAVSKWKLYARRGRVARSQKQLLRMISEDKRIDVLAILEARATWSSLGRRLGLCQFRRTWSNSIAIDFLAVHPALLAPQKQISGVGTAMLYCVARIAMKLKAKEIWLETTDLSAEYYGHLFGIRVNSDLLVVSGDEFYNRLHVRFQSAKAETNDK